MKQKKFLEDLDKIYLYLNRTQEHKNSYFKLAKGEVHLEAQDLVENFLEVIGVESSKEAVVASLTYLINLREDSLEQLLKKQGFTKDIIESKLELAYHFNSKKYLQSFEDKIKFIKDNNLLTPFYREIISGIHSVGVSITKWQSRWRAHIINGINQELFELFKGDEDKIFDMLHKEELLDCKDGNIADRCYSVLVKTDSGYKRLSYADAFTDEVIEVSQKLSILIDSLQELEDCTYNQKQEWIDYFLAIKEAFLHTNPDNLVSLWADVDRAWMKITTPLQVGHPLEYYEDKYRKAVALEWDLRVINPQMQKGSEAKESIKKFATKLAEELGSSAEQTISKNLLQIDRTQLYIGQPMLYYGAELNGLFSAQVVPNDEEVSSELGKKIFAYIDFVRESKKSKPIMQLSIDFFGNEFIEKQKLLIENDPKLWNKIYDITTIGHEFGHILWIDSDTEVVMNKKGQFKNIEEFKATTGGLMAFFENEDSSLKEHIVNDVVHRAVNLMAWREVTEVQPYYCEGLIHLELLYKSELLKIDNNIVKIDYSKYNSFKNIYKECYNNLAKTYINKDDASNFLNLFTIKEGEYFIPKSKKLAEFTEYYYSQYKKIGNNVAEESV